MRSDLRPRLVLLLLSVGVISACAFGGGTEDRDGPDVPIVTALPPEDWRPPSPFIAGTSLIAIQQPLRCHRYPLDINQVAFTWTPSGQRRVYIAIYDEQPLRENGEVKTTPIWTWMSGDTRSDVGRLHWDDGVVPGPRSLPDWEGDVPKLNPGTYWFVIWAWDESRQVVASSEARRFLVANLAPGDTPLSFCCDAIESGEEVIRTVCAPELPPEAASCPPVDAGIAEDWPCYCAWRDAGQSCL